MFTEPKSRDIHQVITDQIVNAIEGAGDAQLPWIRSGQRLDRPQNIASRNRYNGVNILTLWITAMAKGYNSDVWGTYRQWQDKGAQVRKGERSSVIVFYKSYDVDTTDVSTGEDEKQSRLVARASYVFNADQVDGFRSNEPALPEAPLFDPIANAEAFAAATHARIVEGGEVACFSPVEDMIHMPERRRFIGTQTSTPAEGWYSTLCHELVHWSGAKSRLDRDLSGRFGKESYAMEELVAELGAAFLCADLAITPDTRPDHAAYIKNWLQVLKNDKKAIFTAASKASQAAKYLCEIS